jgi:flagellar export protein FliJ
MTARMKRLDRVRAVWEEDLHRAAAALSDARARAEAAQSQLDDARGRTRAGKEAKSAAIKGGVSAEEWRSREAWIATCTAREERAFQARVAADHVAAKALRVVTEAQQKLERLRLVVQRLAEGEAVARRRAERRDEDEHAARAHARGGP